MDTVKTIILRFRDLVTSSGQTIIEHNDIIKKKGFVWWGWWQKPFEQVPFEVFTALHKKIENEGSIEIVLFDTGELKLFKAACDKIEWSNKREKLKSPDSDSTPNYYRDQEYLAWFRFRSIDVKPLSDTELSKFAYIDVPAFFSSPEIDYSSFNNKVVASNLELKQQDRTIWFVRDSRPSDLNHEIRIANPKYIVPSDFPKDFRATAKNRLIWVSDLHFGHTHGFIQDVPVQNQNKSLGVAIENACSNLKKTEIAGVIASGDISSHGKEEGYKNAYDNFFAPLCSLMTANDFYNWIICPGNHDFGFADSKLEEGKDVPAPTSESTKFYSDFYNRLFKLYPNKYFCSGRRWLLGNAYPVEIIALNSVNLQQVGGAFQGHGYVGHEQLDFAKSQYNWQATNKVKPIRIAVLHHHMMPITYTESTQAGSRYSISLDAEALTRWMLENDVKLVLHGHMHQPSIATIKRPINITSTDRDPKQWPELTICSLGSSGVRAEEFGEIRSNMFGIISFEDQCIRIEVYTVHPQVPTKSNNLIFEACLPI
jgi:hypothetical protein